jgi:predicted methyltransferase
MESVPTLAEVLEEVAAATQLAEGPPGAEALLRVIHKGQPISPKEAAAQLGFPIPLVSAIRRELEKRGWLVRKGGMVLSEQAAEALEKVWGPASPPARNELSIAPTEAEPETLEELTGEGGEDLLSGLDYIPLALAGGAETESDDPFLELLDEIFEERPPADPRWDQSHATLETVLRRADLFLHQGSVQGKRILFLGDDDLTSLVTLLLVRKNLGEEALRACAAVVIEADPELAGFIEEIALGEDLPLAVLRADLRQPLPTALPGGFDFFFTDPPYTPEGVNLFVDRGTEALDPKGLRKAALAVPLSPPHLQDATQCVLREKGFLIDYLDPGFNEYLGATMQGGISAMYGLTLLHAGKFSGGPHSGVLYTGEVRARTLGLMAVSPEGSQRLASSVRDKRRKPGRKRKKT